MISSFALMRGVAFLKTLHVPLTREAAMIYLEQRIARYRVAGYFHGLKA